ncbi:winged helix-turn-helix transcriptional regulator [Sphingorhabdus sp. SMR4y]|uniref:winged helix-turn-helix transcriptional regulator n=1 Tax=Sphingorhabdus sp. SMR4y TaxID=2584094 RepID=UPI000B61DBA0|nr:helix-turn-helix domain-containing protein [Sphingorhabdus sp. SMR4y]ASK89974.1 HTH-type transcriptional regulator YodB [Sphingorhabdus sp. SMR4y]
MNDQKSNRPIMILLETLGKRWALRIMWELRNGPFTFRALQESCDMLSPTTLNARLGDLKSLGIIEHQSAGYQLTAKGLELAKVMISLTDWADREITPRARS